jgi:ABC-type multidrug transport system fused ATPase/permease subunit
VLFDRIHVLILYSHQYSMVLRLRHSYFSNLRMTMGMLPNAINSLLMVTVSIGTLCSQFWSRQFITFSSSFFCSFLYRQFHVAILTLPSPFFASRSPPERLQKFLLAEDLDDSIVERLAEIPLPADRPQSADGMQLTANPLLSSAAAASASAAAVSAVAAKPFAISIEHATFKWEAAPPADNQAGASASAPAPVAPAAPGGPNPSSPSAAPPPSELTPVLTDVNLCVAKGSLTVIVGAVGSGKSSLLMGLLGEIKRVRGSVKISGSVGFCAQQSWMQSASLRDNILFGRPYDAERYAETIRVCALSRDLEVRCLWALNTRTCVICRGPCISLMRPLCLRPRGSKPFTSRS